MRTPSKHFKTVDEYLSVLPEEVRKKMAQIRRVVKESAPDAAEVISYNMPAFKLHGVLLYFAAYKDHIGLYPCPSGIAAFEKELAKYKSGKGSVRFPMGKPVPCGLIRKIVRFRIKDNLERAKARWKSSGRANVRLQEQR